MFDAAEYSSASECLGDQLDTISKRKRSRNKRRFSDEQIRSLEVMFESDTKLEPRKKAQLAKELGLQPRQIAIWFQNRRARWKSKQMEKDYSVLMANYNNLASQIESLKKENQSLSLQLEEMKKEDCENSGEKNRSENREICSSDGESDYRLIDFEVKNILDEEKELMKMVEPAVDSSLTSSEDWGGDDLINQPSQWWDFWG